MSHLIIVVDRLNSCKVRDDDVEEREPVTDTLRITGPGVTTWTSVSPRLHPAAGRYSAPAAAAAVRGSVRNRLDDCRARRLPPPQLARLGGVVAVHLAAVGAVLLHPGGRIQPLDVHQHASRRVVTNSVHSPVLKNEIWTHAAYIPLSTVGSTQGAA